MAGDAIYTIGHSTRTLEELVGVLLEAGVRELVDVRTVPRSRRPPQFERDALATSLPEHGLSYRHEKALGGFRRPRPGSPNGGWDNEAFQGYADHLGDPDFADALTIRGWRVLHLGLGSQPVEHELTPFAVLGPGHALTYPPAQGELWR